MISYLLSIFLLVNGSIPTFKSIGDKMYIGVENLITLDISDCVAEDVTIKVSEGILQKRTDSTYVFYHNQVTEEIKIKLYYKKILCAAKTISVDRLPEVKVAFAREKDGFIRISDLTDIGDLELLYASNFPEHNKSVITSFSLMTVNRDGMSLYSTEIRGKNLDKQSIDQLKKLTPGDIIRINNVITQDPHLGVIRMNINKQITVVR